MKKEIKSQDAPAAIGPYSQAVENGPFIFLSGQIAGKDAPADIEDQTRRVFANIESVLSAAGLTLANVVKCQVFMVNLEDFSKMNDVYKAAFEPHGIFPARTTVEVARLPAGVLIEIDVTAMKE